MIRRLVMSFLCTLMLLYRVDTIHDGTNPFQIDNSNLVIFKNKITIAYIKTRCKQTHIPERLVFNIIRTESSWKYPESDELIGDSLVQSSGDAYGLMQIQLPTAWEMMDDESITAHQLMKNDTLNIECGIRYLVWLQNYYHGNMYFAITAYNRGILQVDKDIQASFNPLNNYAYTVTKGVFFGKKLTKMMQDTLVKLFSKTDYLQ